jgi:hypothetical protein
MEPDKKADNSEEELQSDRREALRKFGRFAAYAAPFTILATSKKAAAATGLGPGGD